MGKIGHLSAWFATSLLVLGGCATGKLKQTMPDALAELAESAAPKQTLASGPHRGSTTDTNSGQKATDTEATQAAAIQEVLIRDLAAKRGFSAERTDAIVKELNQAGPTERPMLTQLALEFLSPGTDSSRDVAPTVLQPQPPQAALSGLIGDRIEPRLATAPELTPRPARQNQPAPSSRRHAAATASSAQSPPTTSPSPAHGALPQQTAASRAPSAQASTITSQPVTRGAGIVNSQLPTEQVATLDQSRWSNNPTAVTASSAPNGNAPDAASPSEPEAVNWRKQLRRVIVGLEEELLDKSLDDTDRVRLESYLGLLHLVSEDREKALEVIKDSRDERELEFWRQTLMGLGILLAPEELPKFKYRAESAADCLRQGEEALASLGPLHLDKLAFCTKVTGFGDYEEFESYAFPPGQQVVLYVEVENYTVEPIETPTKQRHPLSGLQGKTSVPMFETELHGRYEILDAQQRTVAARLLPVDRNRCRNHRRDYFIPYMLYIPEKIQSGSYTLELVIEDKKGDKFGSAIIDFRVR